jgi:suppressor for copper-sensitivity B
LTRFRLWILLALSLLAHPGAAFAAASDWVRHPEIALRLVAANSGTGTQGAVGLGLEMQLAPGWKTYWRSPGDAGLPPTIDWAGSDNLANAALRFPVPERFTLFGLETYGYGGTVILPIEAALHTPGEALRVRAGVDVLVCEVVCIPYRAELALDLAAGPGVCSAASIGRITVPP